MMVRGLRTAFVAHDLQGLERTKCRKVQHYSDTEDILGLVPEDQPDREQPSNGEAIRRRDQRRSSEPSSVSANR
jgi:hypothetical protein